MNLLFIIQIHALFIILCKEKNNYKMKQIKYKFKVTGEERKRISMDIHMRKKIY